MNMHTTRAVFLDRDGTMIHEAGYLSRIEDVRWYAGTREAIRLLKRAGFLVFVVTNQGGIGLGLFDEAFVRSVHAAMEAEIVAAGGAVDGWFHCPHHRFAAEEALRTPCACRKPGRAMIDAACRGRDIDLTRSWVIGDREMDVQLAAAVGARGILVSTGHGLQEARRMGPSLPPDTIIAADLMEAVAEVLTR